MTEGIHEETLNQPFTNIVEKQEAEILAQGTAFEFAYLHWLFQSPEYQAYLKEAVEKRRKKVQEAGEVFKEEQEKRAVRNEMVMAWNEVNRDSFRLRWKQDPDFREEGLKAIHGSEEEKEEFFKKVQEWFLQEQKEKQH